MFTKNQSFSFFTSNHIFFFNVNWGGERVMGRDRLGGRRGDEVLLRSGNKCTPTEPLSPPNLEYFETFKFLLFSFFFFFSTNHPYQMGSVLKNDTQKGLGYWQAAHTRPHIESYNT